MAQLLLVLTTVNSAFVPIAILLDDVVALYRAQSPMDVLLAPVVRALLVS